MHSPHLDTSITSSPLYRRSSNTHPPRCTDTTYTDTPTSTTTATDSISIPIPNNTDTMSSSSSSRTNEKFLALSPPVSPLQRVHRPFTVSKKKLRSRTLGRVLVMLVVLAVLGIGVREWVIGGREYEYVYQSLFLPWCFC
jgi:hypothetical protein